MPVPARPATRGPGRLALVIVWAATLITMVNCAGTGGRAGELRRFTTDGCSCFPDGTPGRPTLWRTCCIEHDIAYWQGGSRAERRAADRRLRACVRDESSSPSLAWLMRFGVALGGSPFYPTPYRWGYGWPYGRAYRPLDASERAQVERRLREYRAGGATAPPVSAKAAVIAAAGAGSPRLP